MDLMHLAMTVIALCVVLFIIYYVAKITERTKGVPSEMRFRRFH